MATASGSLAFGHLLGTELQKQGLHYTPHYTLPLMKRYRHELLDRRSRRLSLRSPGRAAHQTRMPAVLLEAGSIANRQEELELATPERRLAVAKAVTAAVTDFCAARAPAAAREVKAPAATAASERAKPASLAH